MGSSLAFHMICAALGIGMPLLMVLAEGLALKTGRTPPRDLARKWAKATGLRFVLYAVPLGLAVLLPSLWLLFRVFKGTPERGVGRSAVRG